MIASAQHKLAQYLSRLLQPISDRDSALCVKDSSTHLLIYSFTHLLIYSFTHLLIYSFTLTVFSKSTSSGQYVKYNSFCHDSRKIYLIKILKMRALQICSSSLLELKLDFFKVLENGYLLEVIQSVQLQQKRTSVWTREVPSLPEATIHWQRFRTAVQRAVNDGYHNARAMVIFQARKMLPSLSKDVVSLLATSNVIYKFVCCCDNSYVGLTS